LRTWRPAARRPGRPSPLTSVVITFGLPWGLTTAVDLPGGGREPTRRVTMRITTLTTGVMVVCGMLLGVAGVGAQDWPQWRGPNRDAKVTGFKAPETWPKELTQKGKVKVGNGVATPALVGEKLYVFSREDPNEVVRCLDAASGNELWQDKYESGAATGPSGQFPGPRSSPTVVGGKVVTLGTRGILTCYDAASGKMLW